MKVAIGADQLLFRVMGGIGSYTRNMINCLNRNKDIKLSVYHSKGVLKPSIESGEYNDIEIPYSRRLLSFSWQFLKVPSLERYLNSVDVVHALNFQIPPVKKKPLIVTVHDLSFLAYPQAFPLYGRFYHRRGLLNMVNMADYIIAVSESARSDLLKYTSFPSEKIKVIYQGFENISQEFIDKKATVKKYKLDFPYILYVGTIEPRKNINILIKAFQNVSRQNNNLKLVLAGSKGWLFKEIIEEINKIVDKIVMLEGVTREELSVLYSNAELFVYPSLYEGFGLPPLEAMANGCPVIVSNSTSLPEVVGDAGLYFNPGEINELEQRINQLLTDESLKSKLKEKGFKKASSFSWEECCRQTIDLYKVAGGNR